MALATPACALNKYYESPTRPLYGSHRADAVPLMPHPPARLRSFKCPPHYVPPAAAASSFAFSAAAFTTSVWLSDTWRDSSLILLIMLE